MDGTQRHGGDGSSRRTPAGDVILRGPSGDGAPGRRHAPGGGARTGNALRAVAIVLGIVAFAAALVTGVALVGGGPAPTAQAGPGVTSSTQPGAPRSTPTAPDSRSIQPYPGSSRSSQPGRNIGPETNGAGGISQARARVAAFVAALNRNDFRQADRFLCASMSGLFTASSLEGVAPGSLGVGGVSLRGNTGTAVVTFRPSGGGEQERAVFGLVVEHRAWMVCDPE